MKIAVSGTAGTGKSTFARVLAEKYALTYIDEGYSSLLGLDKDQLIIDKLEDIFIDKSKAELNANGGFVSDRCPIDLIHLCIKNKIHIIDGQKASRFIGKSIQAMKTYDFIIIPPWNSIKLEKSNGGQLNRNMNPLIQMSNHSNITGYVHMFVRGAKIIELPRSLSEIEQRVEYADKLIRKRRPDLFGETAAIG